MPLQSSPVSSNQLLLLSSSHVDLAFDIIVTSSVVMPGVTHSGKISVFQVPGSTTSAVVISILGQESLLAVLDATKGINLDVDVGSATCTIHAFHDGYGAQIPTLNILAVQNITCRLMFKELNVFWAFVFFSSGPSLNRPLGVPDPNHNSVGFNLYELQAAHMAAPEFPYSNESPPDWSLGCTLRVATQEIENLCSFLRIKNMIEGWRLGASGVLGPFWQND